MNRSSLAALLIGACSATSALAAPIVQVSAQGAASARTAEMAFLGSGSGFHTETFETAGPGSQAGAISTSVGTFTSITAGNGGACDHGAYSCTAGLAALDASSSPFGGRAAAPAGAGNNNWLDSMDAQAMTFTASGVVTSIGFYLSDANDAGGRMSIDIGGFVVDLFDGALRNGSLFYVTLFDLDGLDGFTLYANNANDGYGLDNVSISMAPVEVPEPATLILLALGLAALTAHRRMSAG